jgi:DNA-binding transcriptional regulator YiaG
MNKNSKGSFAASLREAVKYARGSKAKVKVETIHIRTTGEDIKDARNVLNVSQPQFARLMSVSPETVKKWEQGKNPIPASVGYWAEGLKTHPAATKRLLLELAGKHLVTEKSGESRTVPARADAVRAARGTLKWPKGSAVSYVAEARAAEARIQENKFKCWRKR